MGRMTLYCSRQKDSSRRSGSLSLLAQWFGALVAVRYQLVMNILELNNEILHKNGKALIS